MHNPHLRLLMLIFFNFWPHSYGAVKSIADTASGASWRRRGNLPGGRIFVPAIEHDAALLRGAQTFRQNKARRKNPVISVHAGNDLENNPAMTDGRNCSIVPHRITTPGAP
jgi:hypothetical protein